MTTPQDQVPSPPKGYASWLDYATKGPLSFSIHARAELAALCKELSETKRHLDYVESFAKAEGIKHIDRLRELNDTQGLLAQARENLVAIDAQRAEAVRERDALRAQVAEMREAILGLGELYSIDGSVRCLYVIADAEARVEEWNALVATLLAGPAPKEQQGEAGR